MMTRERELLQQALDALESLFTMKVDADRAKKCGDAVVAIRAHLAAQPAPVPLTAERDQLRERERVLSRALSAMLTHMGMDEDEWNKPTFDQARKALSQ